MTIQARPILTLPVRATATLTAHRFATAGGAAATAAGNTLGVTQHDASSGSMCSLTALGTTPVEAGAAITAGSRLEVGTDGKAVTLDEGVAVAVALEAATGDGHKIEVFLIPN